MNQERAQEPQGWIVARAFPSQTTALRAFVEVRDLLLAEDLDASVLRFVLNGRNHVAVLGEVPLPAEADQKVIAVIERRSEASPLPDEVADHLRSRRQQFKATGFNYLERRTVTESGEGA